MRIQFWGVRGSIPTPLLPSQIHEKIAAIIERVAPADLETPATQQRFLAALPPWLYGTTGGNTACLSVELDDPQELIVFDAGSGIRDMGINRIRRQPKTTRYHILFSHFHWDHIMGFPFFNPGYDPSVAIDFYSPKSELEQVLRNQMEVPCFPVPLDAMGAKKVFHQMSGPVAVGKASVSYKKMKHPQDSYAYQVSDGGRRFVYATDVELSEVDFDRTEENSALFEGVDAIVLDSQYTLGEAIEKYGWGHSAFSMAVDFAAHWGIKRVFLFHHDPTYNDRKLFDNLQAARAYAEHMNFHDIVLTLAIEGLEISL
jgi:phosphoribosyl 1,2-cyclic phosphodiesterase